MDVDKKLNTTNGRGCVKNTKDGEATNQNQERSDCTQESDTSFPKTIRGIALLRAVAPLLVLVSWSPHY